MLASRTTCEAYGPATMFVAYPTPALALVVLKAAYPGRSCFCEASSYLLESFLFPSVPSLAVTSTVVKYAMRDSNSRPPGSKPGTLSAELMARVMPPVGIEPTSAGLKDHNFTVKLRRLVTSTGQGTRTLTPFGNRF